MENRLEFGSNCSDVYVTELSLVLLLLCARGGILSNELNTLHQETTGAFWFSAEQQ